MIEDVLALARKASRAVEVHAANDGIVADVIVNVRLSLVAL